LLQRASRIGLQGLRQLPGKRLRSNALAVSQFELPRNVP
jgi:hypothetical protein